MVEIRFCRNCIQWHTTRAWKGNCWKHPWKKDKYSQEASTGDCPDYVDKYAKDDSSHPYCRDAIALVKGELR